MGRKSAKMDYLLVKVIKGILCASDVRKMDGQTIRLLVAKVIDDFLVSGKK